MGLKIAHLYWDTNGNWGDKVLGHATRGLIREFLDVDDITIFGTGPIPPDQRLDEINQHDVLFIGGGGMLMWLMAFVRKTSMLADIKIPIVVYGIGFNTFSSHVLDHGAVSMLQLLQSKCCFMSLRCDESAQQIREETGVVFRESPPPATWIKRYCNTADREIPERYVIISLAGDMVAARLNPHNINPTQLGNHIQGVIQNLQESGYQVQILGHRGQDNWLGLESCVPWSIPISGKAGWHEFKNINRGLGLYQHAHMVIGMRGHAQIIPFSYSVPTIAISTQRKNTGFMKAIGMSDYVVPVQDSQLYQSVLSLIDRVEIHNVNIRDDYNTTLDKFWTITTSDFEEIKEKL